jgi:hypothetical protein
MLDIIKRVEAKDKTKKRIKSVPPTERDEDTIAERDQEIITRHETETGFNLGDLKSIFTKSKEIQNNLNESHPIVESLEKPWSLNNESNR